MRPFTPPLPGTQAQKEQWHHDHARCPKCKGVSVQTTTIGTMLVEGVAYADPNEAKCMLCPWKGKTADLVPLVKHHDNPA
jgi:hypothetical protein